MQHNYYFLKQLSQSIARKLGATWQLGRATPPVQKTSDAQPMLLGTCFSQNKDELVLGFCHENEDFYIKAILEPNFSTLAFATEYHRAKRNSVNLFQELLDLKVLRVIQYLNERCFSLEFENNYSLLFKMHGRRSNIILWKEDRFVIAFHKKMQKDQDIAITSLDRPLEQSFEAFEKAGCQWNQLYPTFGKPVKNYLENQGFAEKDAEGQWQQLEQTTHLLETPVYYVLNPDTEPVLTLLPPQEEKENTETFSNPLEAINAFYHAYAKITHLQKEKNTAFKLIQKKIKQAKSYIDKNMGRLIDLDDSSKNEENGHLLMANLHQISTGVTSVEVFDFYHNTTRTIKLKKDLSPQKNAEIYYRKAKNEKIELQVLQKNVARKEQELETLQNHWETLETFEYLKDLRRYLKDNGLGQNQKSNKPNEHLFKKFSYRGFEIWVGKNARNNDLLTQKYAYKEDLWLHAKDVSGSHVVIKYQAGKPFPRDVLEKAASLAAYYSKRSADTLCPVMYTPKKYVRKTRDLAPGQVLVEKEQVMMVLPEKF